MVSFKGMLCGRFVLMGIKVFHTPGVYEPGPVHHPGLTWGCECSLLPRNTIKPINSSMRPQGLSTPTFPMPQLHLKAKASSFEPCQLWTALSLCYSVLLFLLPLKKKKKTMSFFSTSKPLHLCWISPSLASLRTLHHQLSTLDLLIDSSQYASILDPLGKTKLFHVSLPHSSSYFSISILLFTAINFPSIHFSPSMTHNLYIINDLFPVYFHKQSINSIKAEIKLSCSRLFPQHLILFLAHNKWSKKPLIILDYVVLISTSSFSYQCHHHLWKSGFHRTTDMKTVHSSKIHGLYFLDTYLQVNKYNSVVSALTVFDP